MSKYDKKTYYTRKADPVRYAAYLERKRRERKARVGYEAKRKAAWRRDNPEDAKRIRLAHRAVEAAIAKGELQRPESCSKCGTPCVPDAHHESYEPENWLKVAWLCDGCHQSVHAQPYPITLYLRRRRYV